MVIIPRGLEIVRSQNTKNSYQRTIQKKSFHTFLRKKFVRGFFMNKLIFLIIIKIIFLIIYI